jgi:hypothetical protein
VPAARALQTAGMDLIEQNKNTVTSFIDALFTKGDLGAVDEFLAEEFVNHDPPLGVTADREGMRQVGAMFRAAFPDWHSDIGHPPRRGRPGRGALRSERDTAW